MLIFSVVNVDGSGTLYGTRRNESDLTPKDRLNSNQNNSIADDNRVNQTKNYSTMHTINGTTICHLDVIIRDAVRDSITTSASNVFEDRTTLTLLYQQPTNEFHQRGNLSSFGGMLYHNNHSNANAVIALDPYGSSLLSTKRKQRNNTIGHQFARPSGLGNNQPLEPLLPPKPPDILSKTESSTTTTSSSSLYSGISLKNFAKTIFDVFQKWFNSVTSSSTSSSLSNNNGKNFLFYASAIIVVNLLGKTLTHYTCTPCMF